MSNHDESNSANASPAPSLSPPAKPTPAQWWAANRWWAVPIAVITLAYFLIPLDGAIDKALHGASFPGDIRRELQALQQYGQGSVSVLLAIAIALLAPGRLRQLWVWGIAAALTGIVTTLLKMGLGRPRPRMQEPYDPTLFLGPFGQYPHTGKDGVIRLVHSWDITAGISSDLWSMPSSHTAFAFVASTVLAAMFPRLRWLVFPLAALVGFARLLFDAHYLSDVLVGGAVGYLLTVFTIRTWGARFGFADRPALA